ncbi:hypothetical protein BGZ96_008978 [Linnemannia gamsii]|uniref:ADP-ribosylglycohydrolase n=1 Tax=Linnemannia gamsii TaxID=64522 RepID=A0ABQ7JXQ3_9FUNG|nr:hypothetical protein BGZ96_008978 [Linnemannia gamsii]
MSTLATATIRDRIRGCLLGNAIGDAYGLATEFMTTRQAKELYGNGPIAFGTDPGYPVWEDHHRPITDRNDFTDDTDQMLVMLQSLQQTRDGILHPINFARRLTEWQNHGIIEIGADPGRGLGYTVGRVLSHRDFSSNPHRAAFEVWDSAGRDLAPNGAVMRTAVAGVEHFWDEHQVVENAMAAAKITHADPRSILSALISSVLISRFLRGGGSNLAEDQGRVWNPRLTQAGYQQELLSYLERGTNLHGDSTLNPAYNETARSEFEPKNYDRIENERLVKNGLAGGTYRDQFKGHRYSDWNKDRPKVTLRDDIGWVGIDNVGEDDAAGALARSVMADYKFLLQQTHVAPSSGPGQRVQDQWVAEMESMCFPQSMGQLHLGASDAIGYTFKCIGISYYGATRRQDPHPTAAEYGGGEGLFRGLMEQVTIEGGDADTNCAVMGSLLGARFGLQGGIPENWWRNLQHLDWLSETIDAYTNRVLATYEAHGQNQ